MEERRLRGCRLLKAGKLSQAEIAGQLGVSRATVSDWARQVAGLPDRWTLARVKTLIKGELGIVYHPNYLNRLLRKLGFSLQKPLPRAREQERELVKAWLTRDLPRVKKIVAAQGNNRVLG